MTTKILNIKSLLVILAIFLAMSTIAITPAKALIYQDSDCIYPNTGFKNGLLIVVVKNTDGTFAEGANVKVYNLSDKLVDSGTTGKYGRFFTILPKGNYYVVAEKDGLKQTSDNFYLRLIERVLITLPENICVKITVLWESNSSPAVGFDVTIIEAVYEAGTTDNNGIVIIPCGILKPETNYTAFALSSDHEHGGTSDPFTTNSEGKAEVTVYVN